MTTSRLTRGYHGLWAATAVFPFIWACSDRPEEGGVLGPSFATVSDARLCAESPDYIVRDRDGFLDAITNAPAGSTIAIAGVVEVDFDFNVELPNITFDCATPGAGLRRSGHSDDPWAFMNVNASGVKVRNLLIDARISNGGAYASHNNDDIDTSAEALEFTGNTVLCASEECVHLAAVDFALATGALIAGNHVRTSGTGAGIHVQGFADVILSDNTVQGEGAGLRGILIRQSRGVAVTRNTVTGDWIRGMSFIEGVHDASIEGNSFQGSAIGVAFVEIERVEFLNNSVACGVQFCLLAGPGSDLLVEGSSFRSSGSQSGINTFSGMERVIIRRNEVVATAPSTDAALGAIRVRTGSGHRVVENVVSGPWTNGLSVRDVRGSSFSGNRVSGSLGRGGVFVDFHDSDITANVVSDVSGAGILLEQACRNELVGNTLPNASGAPVVDLSETTGANRYVGNPSGVVDRGSFDCDGDGLVDPNRVVVGRP